MSPLDTESAHTSMSGCYSRVSVQATQIYDVCTQYTNAMKEYVNHLSHNLSLSYQMGTGSFYFYVHALVPSWFEQKGEYTVYRVYDQLYTKKQE